MDDKVLVSSKESGFYVKDRSFSPIKKSSSVFSFEAILKKDKRLKVGDPFYFLNDIYHVKEILDVRKKRLKFHAYRLNIR